MKVETTAAAITPKDEVLAHTFAALTTSECSALIDCSRFPPGQYIWSPKTMARLEARGLVRDSGVRAGNATWALTEDGTAVLAMAREADRVAKELEAAGYCRVSNRFRHLARIDRADWQEHMVRTHSPWLKGKEFEEELASISRRSRSSADYYRRVLSRDVITVEASVFRLLPASGDSDAVMFIGPSPEGAIKPRWRAP